MYHTFKEDYSQQERFDVFIKPQIDILNVEKNWKVKIQICNNLPAFQIEHNDIRVALICVLADEDPQVRSSALSCLFKLGIFSKESLKSEMIRLGMLPNDKGQVQKDESLLDVLYKKSLQLQSSTMSTRKDQLESWFSKYDLNHSVLYRESSYIQHLVYPELSANEVLKSTAQKNINLFSGDIKGWESDLQSNLLSNRKVKTALDKIRPIVRPNTSQDSVDKDTQRPFTASFVPRVALKKRAVTARQKARWGARCFLAGKVDLTVQL